MSPSDEDEDNGILQPKLIERFFTDFYPKGVKWLTGTGDMKIIVSATHGAS